MSKDLNVSNLLIIYGNLLDTRVREILIAYYDLDMTLAELAEQFLMTRQGVRDIIVRNTDYLNNLEANLNIKSLFDRIDSICEEILIINKDITVTNNVNNIKTIINKE